MFAAVIFFAAPGSVDLARYAGAAGAQGDSPLPGWARPCLDAPYVSVEGAELAVCARVDGRVTASIVKDDGDTHVLVAGGFHLTLVQLPHGAHAPSWGSRIVAVGPLGSTDGVRELQAIRVVSK
jgi:hypothetical protein